jgi:hypothetical protein
MLTLGFNEKDVTIREKRECQRIKNVNFKHRYNQDKFRKTFGIQTLKVRDKIYVSLTEASFKLGESRTNLSQNVETRKTLIPISTPISIWDERKN